jgi:hypothetical protein
VAISVPATTEIIMATSIALFIKADMYTPLWKSLKAFLKGYEPRISIVNGTRELFIEKGGGNR